MSDDSREEKIKNLRGRLEELNRSFVKDRPASFSVDDVRKRFRGKPKPPPVDEAVGGAPKAVTYGRMLPRRAEPKATCRAATEEAVLLEDAVDGEVIKRPNGRSYLHVDTEVETVEKRAGLSAQFLELLGDSDSGMYERLEAVCGQPITDPSEIVFMDIETTGLSNLPLFLIGVMVWEDGAFHVLQYLARSYAEETAVIGTFVDRAASCRVIVTFNGKSFDVPYIRTRAIGSGTPFDVPQYHVDLLHISRKVWRSSLPNCKLQTLESIVCGHGPRIGDIPGAEIGDAYHAFVRSGDAWQIVEVLKHNMLDLITLAQIMTHLPGAEPTPGT
jgi:uncharacterized protein